MIFLHEFYGFLTNNALSPRKKGMELQSLLIFESGYVFDAMVKEKC
jgi:hypothetical protein